MIKFQSQITMKNLNDYFTKNNNNNNNSNFHNYMHIQTYQHIALSIMSQDLFMHESKEHVTLRYWTLCVVR